MPINYGVCAPETSPRRAAANLARSLGHQSEDTIRTTDISILGSVERLEIDGTGPDAWSMPGIFTYFAPGIFSPR